MAGDQAEAQDAPDDAAAEDGADEREESMPPFLTYGLFTVGVYAVAVTGLVWLSGIEVGGATLVAFTVGFLVFMTVYFAAMWAGWLLF